MTALANGLDAQQLRNKVVRLESAIEFLRRAHEDSEGDQPLPAPMRAAIADFGRDLARVNDELRRLDL